MLVQPKEFLQEDNCLGRQWEKVDNVNLDFSKDYHSFLFIIHYSLSFLRQTVKKAEEHRQ